MPDAAPVINSLLTKVERVSLDQLTQFPGNPNEGDVEEIAKSLKTNALFEPIIVQRSSGHILSHNHVTQAAEQLGWTHLDVIYVDVDDDQAKRIVAAANRTAELSTRNDYLLAELLQEISDTDLGLEGTGYDTDALDDLTRVTGMIAAETTSFLEGFTEAGAEDSAQSSFSHAIAPPAAGLSPGAAASPAAAPGTVAGTAVPPHTGPQPYSGPGSPQPAGSSAPLPAATPMTTVSWVVTAEDRDIIREAVKTAQQRWQTETLAEGLVAVCRQFLFPDSQAGDGEEETETEDETE